VLNINPGSLGVVQLIGLNITGGYISSVRAHMFKTSHRLDGNIDDMLASTLALTTAADAPVNYRRYVPQRPVTTPSPC